MSDYFFLMDVGGTKLKVNCLTLEGQPLFKKNREFDAQSESSREVILTNFKQIIQTITSEMYENGYQLKGVGLTFPGPFNYQKGFSLMKGLRKYDSIYHVNLKKLIESWIWKILQVEVPVIFENDGTAFGYGEYHHEQSEHISSGIYLTIGTGCGSAFIKNGLVINDGYGLNKEGMIYDRPYRNSQIDDYLSHNGLTELSKSLFGEKLSGLELYDMAQQGELGVLRIFSEFGVIIAEALAQYVSDFQPDEVVFGGAVSESLSYFLPSMIKELEKIRIEVPIIRKSKNTSLASFKGLVTLLNK